jgi:hypothetical protein
VYKYDLKLFYKTQNKIVDKSWPRTVTNSMLSYWGDEVIVVAKL